MIKAKKGLLIALFAAMMVFAFGATSAFASNTDAHHSFDGITTVNADYDGLKVLVEPTCSGYGVGEITCTTDVNGEPCGAVKTVKINPLGHEGGKQVPMKVGELMDKFNLTDVQKAAYVAAHPTWCEKYVYVCDHCGALVYQAGSTWRTYTSINDIRDTAANPWVQHSEPSDVKKCAETFTCTECGVEGLPRTHEAHDFATQTTKAHKINDTTYVLIETKTCKECGKVDFNRTLEGDYSGHPELITHGTTTDVTVPSEMPCKIPNTVNKVCNDCGMTVSSTEKLEPHNYQTTLPYTKAGSEYLWVCDKCVVCGDEKNERQVGYAPEPGTGSVSYEAVSAANCEQGSFLLATSKDAAGEVIGTQVYSDTQVETETALFEKINGEWYSKATKEKVPYTEKIGHKFGQMKPVAEATCTEQGYDAKVCENCNKIDHESVRTTEKALGHDPVVLVEQATCGEGGYTHSVCSRCDAPLNKNGKTDESAPYSWDQTKPVVGYGVECTFEWKVLQEPTAFDLGTRAKVCTKCGYVWGATQESIAKTTIPAPAVKAGKKKAVVTVKEVPGAVQYQILVNGAVKKTVTDPGKYTIKKLKGGKKYSFQIKATDANGVDAISAAKKVKIKKK